MQLEQFVSILLARKKTVLAVFVVVVLATLAATLLMPKTYTAETVLVVDVKANDPVTGQPVMGALVPGYMATQTDIITSRAAALKVVETLKLMERFPETRQAFLEQTGGNGSYPDWFADLIAKGLNVRPSRESNVIVIEYNGVNPAFASEMANAFARAYISMIVDMRTAAAQQNSQWYAEQVQRLKGNYEKAQAAFADFQQKSGIVADDERLDVENQKLNEIASQLVQAQGMTYDAQARIDRSGNGNDVINNPVVQQLRVQIAEQEAKLQELSQSVGPNHPRYQELDAQLAEMRQQLTEQSRVVGGGLKSVAANSAVRQASLQRSWQAQKARVLELKSQRSRLDLLQRELENAKKTYDFALDRMTQQTLESRSDYANVSILRLASEPYAASWPKPGLNLLVASLLGLVLGVGMALLLELITPRVRTPIELANLFAAPVVEVSRPSARRRLVRRLTGWLSGSAFRKNRMVKA